MQPLGCSIFSACCKIASGWRVTARAIKMHIWSSQKWIVHVLDLLDLKVWVQFSLPLALHLSKPGNPKHCSWFWGLKRIRKSTRWRWVIDHCHSFHLTHGNILETFFSLPFFFPTFIFVFYFSDLFPCYVLLHFQLFTTFHVPFQKISQHSLNFLLWSFIWQIPPSILLPQRHI